MWLKVRADASLDLTQSSPELNGVTCTLVNNIYTFGLKDLRPLSIMVQPEAFDDLLIPQVELTSTGCRVRLVGLNRQPLAAPFTLLLHAGINTTKQPVSLKVRI